MYKVITIGGKDYRLEYSIEATLYPECLEEINNLFNSVSDDASLKSLSTIPKSALTIFYAGMLEHHGIDADKSCMSIHDAKMLVKQWMKENNGTWDDLASLCFDQLREDDFFKLIGVDLNTQETPQEEETQKK